MKLGKTINEIKIGDGISVEITITDEQIKKFAEATGDFNPLHVDDDYAKKSPFKKRVAHGVLLSGIVSGVIGMKLPGLGTVARDMYSKFMRPVFIGDVLTIDAKITEIKEKIKTCKIEFIVKNQDKKKVGKGYATVIPRI